MKFDKIIDAVNDQSRVRGFTHRFYTYPAGFSPVFVEAAIKSLSKKNDLILDPFVGGGTTLIEALRSDRKVVGIDYDNIEKWADTMSKNINFNFKNDRFVKKALSIINYKGLGKKEISNLKKIIKGTSFYLKNLKKIKNKKENDFLRLLLLRCLHSTLHDKRPIADFHVFKSKIRSNSLDMLEGMKSLDPYLKNSRNEYKIYNKSSSHSHRIKELKSKKVSLILTSPPYPGINIPYSRWQIHGRRNTTLPYLILGLERPKIKSIYNFQNPTNNTFDVYFNTMRNIFSSLRKISSNKTLILQLVAFNNKDGVFSKYLKTMEECGFKELKIKSNGYIWRKVPNRSWQARLKGNIPASNEVLLLHKLK